MNNTNAPDLFPTASFHNKTHSMLNEIIEEQRRQREILQRILAATGGTPPPELQSISRQTEAVLAEARALEGQVTPPPVTPPVTPPKK